MKRTFFNYAIECHFLQDNPAKGVKNLREAKDEHWIPTKAQFLKLVDAAEETSSGSVLVPWLWFMAYTGARPNESVQVQWATDIRFSNDQIRILNSKRTKQISQKYRYVEMHPELKPILLNWKQEWEEIFKARSKRHPDEPSPPHDWVFFNPRNQDERANSFFKCFYQAREKAGLPEMTRHTLRHYFISQCVMSGIEFFTIAKWVGHTNTKMIEEVYGHLDPSFRRSQMAKLRVVPEEKVEGAA